MTRRLALHALLLVGCFSPKFPEGLLCGDGQQPCPPDQRCGVDGRCHADPGNTDDATLGEDAHPSDASGDAFRNIEQVAELAGPGIDQDPALSTDLRTIFFASARSGGHGGTDIWAAEAAGPGQVFGGLAPIELVNSMANETHPCLTPDGRTLYFDTDRGNGQLDIYRTTRAAADGAWSTPAIVGELTSAAYNESAVAISPSGQTMVFVSDRNGNRDLYYSTFDIAMNRWGMPVHIVETATPAVESSPWLTDTELYFVRDSGSAKQMIYRAPIQGQTLGTPTPVEELGAAADPWLTPDGRIIYFSRGLGLASEIYRASR